MIPLYVFAAILGGGLLLIGMLGGGDHDGSGGDHFQADFHFGGKDLAWKHVFSIRTAAYVLAAFGLTGTLLTLVGAGAVTSLLLSVGMGVFGGALSSVVFRWVKGGEGGFAVPSHHYIGGLGRTEVRIPAGGRGRIQLVHAGRAFTLPAISSGGEIDRLEHVIVLDVIDGTALVERAPRELISP